MALSDLEGLTAVCGIAIKVILRRIMRQVCRSQWEAPSSCKGRLEESMVQEVGAGDCSQPVPTVAGLSRDLENDQRRCRGGAMLCAVAVFCNSLCHQRNRSLCPKENTQVDGLSCTLTRRLCMEGGHITVIGLPNK